MQVELIDTFLDLIETRSFHRSAERLGVTQSTVSARIQALEAALGARLLNRSRAGTDLTTEGLRFEASARLLRQEWTEAVRAVAPQGDAALTLRISLQNDLVPGHIGALVADFRAAFPQTAFYIEPDYSTQICADLVTGVQDFGLMFTPKPHPDLHFASVGEITYRLISSHATARADIDPSRYITANFSPAFARAHRQTLPELTGTPLSAGQSSTIAALLQSIGGTGFVLAETAAAMIGAGNFTAVSDVEPMTQPVYAGLHLRHRTSTAYRRMVRIAARRFG